MTFNEESDQSLVERNGITYPNGSAKIIPRVEKWSAGQQGTGNMLIHGDNLEVLNDLADCYTGAVQCIYLDPPYNNGESYQHYFDSMGHEQWLSAVTDRLKKARPLLAETGSVWISIDDSELHYLKVAADGVFGRENFVGTIIWERRTTRENRRMLSMNHEYLLVYAKNLPTWERHRNTLPLTESVTLRYQNPDADPRGPWQSVSANVQDGHATPQQFYSIKSPRGLVHNPPKGRCWVYAQPKMLQEIAKNNIWFGKDGLGVPRIKRFLCDRKDGLTPETLWRAEEVGTTSSAKKHLVELFNSKTLFDTPKPEALLHRILHIATNPGDLVVDAYLGSGTTAAVAHKMGRQYIGIENGEHIKTHCAYRLKKVIAGETGGISGLVGWAGGGGYDFFKHTRSSRNNAA
ncbi:type III restriction-modification system methyltransferase [Bordetella ansorpii]|uniref:Methyltransferase n=1 Tax=Bordetella ansorpii TaxID=288768 RepID=A0A157SB83_9BORD|nr:site-specific DNA-methyltransferase [Bordetella ansorpii]SAI67493.1 type III restriction-modification system methyltransferase [Bordetella ansorpii]